MTTQQHPVRVQMSRQHPWRAEHPDAVIVARPSRWGNPYRVGDEVNDRADAVDAFRAYALWLRSIDEDAFEEWLAPLRGHDLACWCPPSSPCHADVLLSLAAGGAS